MSDEPIARLRDAAFPIVISGPSGAGKTVLCRRLCSAFSWTTRAVTYTTRPPRGGEREGESYFFCTEGSFREELNRDGFAEWAEVHGHLYGTPRRWLDHKLRDGFCVVLNIDVQGGLKLRAGYPDALLIFLLPPSWEQLERRLRRRGTDPPEEIARRLAAARQELEALPRYDYVIVNNSLPAASGELFSIVRAERARVRRRLTADPREPSEPRPSLQL